MLLSSHVASVSVKADKKSRQSAAELVIKCHNSEKLINIVNWIIALKNDGSIIYMLWKDYS